MKRYGIGLVLAASAALHASDADTVICFEAEACERLEAPMRIVEEAPARPADDALKQASGRKYLDIPQRKSPAEDEVAVRTGKATYVFEVDTDGEYVLWCRVWWTDECSNSFSVRLDGGPPFTIGQDASFGNWHWVGTAPGLKQLRLASGSHALDILEREDGVKLDQILLTPDKAYVPVDVVEAR